MIAVNNLSESLTVASKIFGDRSVLCFDSRWSTFRGLENDSDKLARVFIGMGIAPQSRVVLHLPNSRDWVVTYFAIIKAGAVVVPIDFMTTAVELLYVIEDSQAIAVITAIEDVNAIRLAARDSSFQLITSKSERSDQSADIFLEDLMQSEPSVQASTLPQLVADDLCTIAYTSGTTGRPKGAMLSHRSKIGRAHV